MRPVATERTTLAQLRIGECARIRAVDIHPEWQGRLAAMGIGVGKLVTLLRKGTLNGPLQLRIGGTELAIRCVEAQRIEVEPLDARSTTPHP